MTNILIFINILLMIIFLIRLNTFPPEIPLFYSKADGEWQITENWMIFLLPFLLNIFFYINNYLLNNFYKNEEIFKKIFYYFNLFLIISFSLIFIKIVFLIT